MFISTIVYSAKRLRFQAAIKPCASQSRSIYNVFLSFYLDLSAFQLSTEFLNTILDFSHLYWQPVGLDRKPPSSHVLTVMVRNIYIYTYWLFCNFLWYLCGFSLLRYWILFVSGYHFSPLCIKPCARTADSQPVCIKWAFSWSTLWLTAGSVV